MNSSVKCYCLPILFVANFRSFPFASCVCVCSWLHREVGGFQFYIRMILIKVLLLLAVNFYKNAPKLIKDFLFLTDSSSSEVGRLTEKSIGEVRT